MSTDIREDLDIAVIGLAGRFPGADNCQEFWRKLLMGVDSVTRFSEQELLEAGHELAKIRNPDYVPVNGLLAGADYFDAAFFGYSQAEAALMDPQTRLMLECVWHALENAGVDPERRGRNIGLFLGARSTVQWTMQAMLSEQVDNVGGFLASQLANKDAMSTLISWKLGLQGPSFTMQTACSTSLVSIHQAVQSLLSGECDFAVAGGVSLLLPQQNGHTWQEGMLFSRDGQTRAFDAAATGSVFGSGLGAVVLRRAGDAIADGDPIRALLKGSAINNDGARKVGYTAPSVKGQAEVMRAALELAQVQAHELDYIECHGTATALGDSIEFMALQEVYGNEGSKGHSNQRSNAGNNPQALPNRCALGAVKTNIGHLDAAAGVAGFIKMVLALQHGVIPPTLYFQQPNPQLGFERSPFYINSASIPWRAQAGRARLGAVSSFGIGGTNAHMVLQAWQAPAQAKSAVANGNLCFALAARTPAALTRQLEALAQWLVTQEGLELAALAHTLARRPSLPCRLLLVADSRAALLQEIKRWLEQEDQAPAPAPALALIHQKNLPPQQLAAASAWLDGSQRSLPPLLLPATDAALLFDLPAYPFERDAHPTGHISDQTWQKIAGVLATAANPAINSAASSATGAYSRNEAGLLLPFERALRLPVVTGPVRAVLLADESLSALCSALAQHGMEASHTDLSCPQALRTALQRCTQANPASTGQALVLTLAFGADAFGLEDAALERLAQLGQILASSDFSGYASTRIYLLHAREVYAKGSAEGSAERSDEEQARAVMTGAALKSLALVAAQEIAGITCSFVALAVTPDSAGAYPAATLHTLAGLLRSSMPGPLTLTAQALTLQDFRSPTADENEQLAAPTLGGKTWVITGAGGRMARVMAQVLATRFGARLALLSRQPADAPAMQALRSELLAAGAPEVEVFPFALAQIDQGLALFDTITQRLGPVFGVIHAAGVTDGASFAPLSALNAGHYREQLDPKARTAQVLAGVFARLPKHTPVEYCFVTSSMSTFFGGIAHAPYAAANLFLDGWGQLQNARNGATRWVVVNWETIHFEARSAAASPAWGANEVALAGEDFPRLFEQTLCEFTDAGQKIVSGGHFVDRLVSWGGRRARPEQADAAQAATHASSGIRLKPRPASVTAAYVPAQTGLQSELAEIWSAILGVEGIGLDDRFMELGGDSLKTIVMAEKVYKKLGKRVVIQDFFVQPTLRELERQCLSAADTQSASGAALTQSIDPAAAISASAAQEALYVHQTTFRDASYNMPVAFLCPARYGVEQISAAIRQVAQRHLILKCRFERRDGKLLLLPQPQAVVPVQVVSGRSANNDSDSSDLARLQAFAAQAFDLDTELPIRALILSAGADQGTAQNADQGRDPDPHQVLIVVHHIVCDAISLGILGADLQSLLQGIALPPLDYSFAAYRQQQQLSENPEQSRKDQAYWLANLLPLPKPLALPLQEPNPADQSGLAADSHRGITCIKPVSPAQTNAIRALCDSLAITPFTFFLGSFALLLSKIGHADAVLLGVPVTGRHQPEELALVGYLVNLLAVKIELEPDFALADYLLNLQAQWQESTPYQRYALNDLLEALQSAAGQQVLPQRQGKHPLFDVVFGYLPLSLNGGGNQSEHNDWQRLGLESETAKFDLLLEVSETAEGFDCTIQYRAQLFASATIEAIFNYLFALFQAAIDDPESCLADILPQLAIAAAPAQAVALDVDQEFDF